MKISARKIKAIVGILLIFLLGALAGSIGTGLLVQKRISGVLRGIEPPATRVLKRMAQRLDLTEAQQAEVGKILRRSHVRLDEIRKKNLPELKKILEGTIEEMKTVLTEEQGRQLERMHNKFKRRTRFFLGFPPPPPHWGKDRPHWGKDRPHWGEDKPRWGRGERFSERLLDRLTDRMALTDAQVEQVRPILEEAMKKRRIIREKYGDDPNSRMEREMKAVRAEFEKSMQGILDDRQKEAFGEFFDKHPFPPRGKRGFGPE